MQVTCTRPRILCSINRWLLTQAKTNNLFSLDENRLEQYFAATIVQFIVQHVPANWAAKHCAMLISTGQKRLLIFLLCHTVSGQHTVSLWARFRSVDLIRSVVVQAGGCAISKANHITAYAKRATMVEILQNNAACIFSNHTRSSWLRDARLSASSC